MRSPYKSLRFIPECTLILLFVVLLCSLVAEAQTNGSSSTSPVRRETLWWGNNSAEFSRMGDDVQISHSLNILAQSDARFLQGESLVPIVEPVRMLIDGSVGTHGDEGRFWVEGQPGVYTFYLGRPRSIHQLNLYTGNVDQRANQRFEVRLANNADKPGEKPVFSDAPTFDSGNTWLGANSGGFKTTFYRNGKPLTDQKYDWVEFRLWASYPIDAGTPITEGKAVGASVYVELQVIGDPEDPGFFKTPADKQAWYKQKAIAAMRKHLEQTGGDTLWALDHIPALKRAIEDLGQTYPDRYDSKKYLAQLAEYESKMGKMVDLDNPSEVEAYLQMVRQFLAFRRQALLANPALDFDRLLVRTSTDAGLQANWMSTAARGKGRPNDKLQVIRLRTPELEMTPVVNAPRNSLMADICLNWDAKRMLVTALSEKNTWQVYEVSLDNPTEFRQITPDMGTDVDNCEGCYVPDGSVIFVSTASMMGVPCISGSGPVGNLFRVDPEEGNKTRQLTFEQDQDWNPVIMPNGRIMYLRWEYTDLPHYFSRIVMSMNPDGTNQLEHYGSNSFWPNSNFYTKPVPGHRSKFVGIVTGHHGEAQRQGELYIFDPQLGRSEVSGVVQQIPGFGKTPEAKITDQLVDGSWPRFLFPTPLNEKYILVTARLMPNDPWGLYLVDVFDNILLLKQSPDYGFFEPTPLIERPVPQLIPPRFDDQSKESTVFITDVYFGPGLQDVPRGTVKKLRLLAYQYGYRGIGGHHLFGVESGWDSKLILGEVPVYEDGSAGFTIPANTPIAIQPLDEKGRAMQLMRSWLVGMPGEQLSCTGCHESQNSVTPARLTKASRKAVDAIQPFCGPTRPFGFAREVQPILDKYCAGCHDGSDAVAADGSTFSKPNFKDASFGVRPDNIDEGAFAWQVNIDPKNASWLPFSKSYMALMPYVRRPGPESDMHMLKPMEYHANTSYLFRLIEGGRHYNVKLDDASMRTLYLWADFNCPFHATWSDVANVFYAGKRDEHIDRMAERTRELRSAYANINDDPESGSGYLEPASDARPEFIKPAPWNQPDTKTIRGNTANANTTAAGTAVAGTLPMSEVTLGHDEKGQPIVLKLVQVPAGQFVIGDDSGQPEETGRNVVQIDQPYWIAVTEITNQMYGLFDPSHDSRYIDAHGKDLSFAGYPVNGPQQPVIRITWQQAQAFCKWLSDKTGRKFQLPTEAQWEYACRAGTTGPFWFAPEFQAQTLQNPNAFPDFARVANMADKSLSGFTRDRFDYLPKIEQVNDGSMVTSVVGRYQANPWGLFDMLGNVSEWTRTDMRPYPYNESDGRNSGNLTTEKVVRGGSWYDRPNHARAGSRVAYPTWQKVYNVGFRVVAQP